MAVPEVKAEEVSSLVFSIATGVLVIMGITTDDIAKCSGLWVIYGQRRTLVIYVVFVWSSWHRWGRWNARGGQAEPGNRARRGCGPDCKATQAEVEKGASRGVEAGEAAAGAAVGELCIDGDQPGQRTGA